MQPINFQQYDDAEVLELFNKHFDAGFLHLTLDRVEAIAHVHGNLSSEKAVSQSYDQWVEELDLDTTDKALLRGAFADYIDMIEKDGLVHRMQLYQYDYVGRLSMD